MTGTPDAAALELIVSYLTDRSAKGASAQVADEAKMRAAFFDMVSSCRILGADHVEIPHHPVLDRWVREWLDDSRGDTALVAESRRVYTHQDFTCRISWFRVDEHWKSFNWLKMYQLRYMQLMRVEKMKRADGDHAIGMRVLGFLLDISRKKQERGGVFVTGGRRRVGIPIEMLSVGGVADPHA